MRLALRCALGLLLALGGGCIDDFDPPSLVTKNRPLAMRAEVVGAPERAWPAPGEAVRLSWLVGDAGEPSPLSWGLLVCPGFIAPTGDELCAGPPLAAALVTEPSLDPPELVVDVPGAEVLGEVRLLVVQGVFCADGVAAVDLARGQARCDGASPTRSDVVATVRLARDGLVNRNPRVGDVSLDGAAWEARPAPPTEGCAAMAGGPDLPLLRVAETRAQDPELQIVPDLADREAFPREGGAEGRESLVYSHFTTAGELERQFSVIEDRTPEARVSWALPALEDVPAAGAAAHFWLVVRDERGGVAFAERWACVAP